MEIIVGMRVIVPNHSGVQGVVTERNTTSGVMPVSLVRWLDKQGRPQVTLCNDEDIVKANPAPVDYKALIAVMERHLQAAIATRDDARADVDVLQSQLADARAANRKPAKKSKRK